MSRSSIDSTRSRTTGLASTHSTAFSSPSLDPIDPAPLAPQSSNLDDIFGSSPPDSPVLHTREATHHPATATPTGQQAEPSDLPSLRRQHVTAGYRDGVSSSKTAHVQAGFDAGYPAGAEMGVRVGIVLGVLEGIVKGGGDGRVTEEFEDAKRELDVPSVFANALGGEGEVEGEGKKEADVKDKLEKAGEGVIARWEDRVRELLATVR